MDARVLVTDLLKALKAPVAAFICDLIPVPQADQQAP